MKLEKLLHPAIYLCLFLFMVFPYSDKDWGWHYQYGKYVVTTGHILRDNTFTWTVPNYHWINHSWTYDPLLYTLTNIIGFTGLSILGGVCALAAFYVVIASYRLKYWQVGILGLVYVRLVEVAVLEGLRSQVVSLLLLGTLIWILNQAKTQSRWLWSLPCLFLIWANFHGDFIFGLGVATAVLGYEFIFNRSSFLLPLIVCVSFLTTLINPYGVNIYREAARHTSNPYLANVYEWMPITNDCQYCHQYTVFSYIFLLGIALIFFRTKKTPLNLPYLLITLALIMPSITTRRYLPLFALMSLPLASSFLAAYPIDLNRFRLTRYLVPLILLVCFSYNVFNRLPQLRLYHFTETDYCSYSGNCSPSMAEYLKTHAVPGKGFNFYDWGGYYIGKGIPQKLFIDGRMHLWKQDDFMPFADYIAMYYRHDYELFKKYNFDWVLVELNSNLGQKIYTTDELGAWKIEFQDGNSILYTRRDL